MEKYYYGGYALGQTQKEIDMFYKELERIKKESKKSDTEWAGDYYITKYEMKNGKNINYWYNGELGIPTMIEYL